MTSTSTSTSTTSTPTSTPKQTSTSTSTSTSTTLLNRSDKVFTWNDLIIAYEKEERILIVVEGVVYDITRWLPHHPGGDLILQFYAAHDATFPFKAFHLPHMYRRLHHYRVGVLHPQSGPRHPPPAGCPHPAHPLPKDESPFIREFRQLDAQFHQNPDYWFRVSLSWLSIKIAWLMFFAVLYTVILLWATGIVQRFNPFPSPWIGAIAVGVVLGLWFQQSAFLAHDALHAGLWGPGHGGSKADRILGWICGNVVMGVGSRWWKENHNLHHALTNVFRSDSGSIIDIQQDQRPIWLQSPRMLFSTTFWERLLLRVQHYSFVPLCVFFGRYAIIFDGIRASWKHPVELIGFLIHLIWLTSSLALFPSTSTALFAHFVAAAVQGILHIQLELSHFVTEMLTTEEVDGMSWPYFQLCVSRNILCPEWLDWFHGGLQFQIEHHLWPRMPRHRLREASQRLKDLCRRHRVTYLEAGFFKALHTVEGGLADVASKLWW